MKLGLYGGGFKPFHTGHFAKLLLALDESDRVLSFFGIKKQKVSKKTGKPLKTNFRSFGDSGRLFDQEMQERVVAIYEKALQDAYPGVLDVVPSADITPISNVHSMLDRFAYSQMTDDEKREISDELAPSLVYQSGDPTTDQIDFNDVDEVVVVAGEDELQGNTYMGAINRRAERGDSRIGEKVKELLDSGKIRLVSGTADEGRLVSLLRQYHPDASDEMVTVRGTGVRDLAGARDIESLSKYLPNILPEDQKQEIIKILVGEDKPVQAESFFMPIITDSTVLRAAARFTAKKKIVEASVSKKGEDHIKGFTEDMSLTFDTLRSLIEDVLKGRVEHIEEKMDGQNFTFTVLDSGEIRLFGKGVSKTTLEKGGLGREDIRNHERWGENIKDAFGSGYEVVEIYLQGKDSDLVKRFFQNGKVVVEGQVMTPVNPNTIPYTENHVRFIRPFTPYDIQVDSEAYRDLFQDADIEISDEKDREWSLGPVPKLEQVQSDAAEISAKISELQGDINTLLAGMQPLPETVGEYAAHVLERYIERAAPRLDLSSLTDDQRKRAMQRLATGDKKLIGKPEMGAAWPEFQNFEKMRTAHVAAAIADLEKIIQKLGSYLFDTLEFSLATNEGVVADLANEVEKIKLARDADQIVVKNADTGEISELVDTSWATKLDSSLARVEQMDLFKKAVEGVVLRMPGENGQQIARKLTGMFTPVHRLVSLFRYPDRASRNLLSISDTAEKSNDLTPEEVDALNEALRFFARNLGLERMLIEGGEAFKNTEGESLSTEINLENVPTTLDHFFKNHLSPAGVELYRLLGSTGKKSKSGDLDIVVGTSEGLNVREFKNRLLSSIRSSLADGDAKLVGQNIGVLYPIQGSQPGDYVQIDVMVDLCPDDTCWLMSGTGDGGVKGVYRNLMLSYIASMRSREGDPSKKFTISFPGGLQIKVMPDGLDPLDSKNKRKWRPNGDRITDPSEILETLGISAEPGRVETFQELVDFMQSDESLSQYLAGFEDYIGRYLGDEKTSAEAQKAVDYIRNNQSLEESLKFIIENLLKEDESQGGKSDFPFYKILWSEKLKMFSSGKWNLWNERVSATADGGKDPEGAEKAVAAMENLIYLGQNGYKITGQEDGGILIQGKGINAKLDADEAIQYIIGLRTSEDSDEYTLPEVRIRHVAGTKPYDLELASTGEALEVKKMGGRDRLSKLGSATGRVFDRHVKIIRPLRDAGQIAQKFIEAGGIIGEDGSALIRSISPAPEGFNIDSVANAVEMIDYFFNKIRFGNSRSELPGIMIKVEGGQIGAGMVRRIKRSDLLNLGERGNLFDECKKALNDTLGDYSPGKERDTSSDDDGVEVKASTGNFEYEGKVSLDYFYDELIYKLFDSDADTQEIDESLIGSYAQCIELLAEIFSHLIKINNNQGEDVFNDFISDLHYGGFYGVDSGYYYSIPCDSDHLDVYGTTQGFRAVLSMTETPPEGPTIPEVKIKNPEPEEDVDLEVDLVAASLDTDDSIESDVEDAEVVDEETEDTEENN